MSLDESNFDFVYSLSMFSHLSAAMIHAWLCELARVTTPGGIVAVTFHRPHALRVISDSAEHQAATHLTPDAALDILGRLDNERVVLVPYLADEISRIKVGTPDYGITFLDSRGGLQLASTIGFEPLAHVSGGLRGFQDILVLRRL